MKEYVQLKEDNILRVMVKDKDGNDTDCVLFFDIEDIELPLRISKSAYEHKKNMDWIKNQFIIIDKKQDKQDGLLSLRERLKLEAFKEFYEKEMIAIDLIIGEGKTKEILAIMKRKPYYSMFEDITDMLEPIMPKLQQTADDVIDRVKEKYTKKEENILE